MHPLINKFINNLKKFTVSSTALIIDETTVKFYGRVSIEQYIKSKPTKYGIKMWALSEFTGFIFECDMYCGTGAVKIDKNSGVNFITVKQTTVGIYR